MDLSVIIVNYNTFALTSNCIRSVLEKTEGLRYEIILVDNASTECPPERFKEQFPEIELVASPQNGGFAKGNNLGLERARGRYLLLLNSDTELLNNALLLAVRQMEQKPNCGVLSGQLQYPDGRLQAVAGRFPSVGTQLLELTRLTKLLSRTRQMRLFLGDRYHYREPLSADWVWGAFFLTRRSILQQLPGQKLPEDFFMYFEDVQWCMRIRKMGYKVCYHPAPKALHYIGGSEARIQSARQKYLEKFLPNEMEGLKLERGRWYAYLYYGLRILHLLSLRKADEKTAAKAIWRKLLRL